jgi:hypothetical protein
MFAFCQILPPVFSLNCVVRRAAQPVIHSISVCEVSEQIPVPQHGGERTALEDNAKARPLLCYLFLLRLWASQ